VTVAEVLLFHHVQGLTPGVQAFAEDLRAAGNEVHVPDLFDGQTFSTLDEAMTWADGVGLEALAERGVELAQELAPALVYAGLSFGVMPAQRLAQQRAGARGALLYHSGIPLGWFGDRWPDDVPLQMHVKEDDDAGDVDDMRELAEVEGAELYVYPGDAHLFLDRSLDVFDPEAYALVLERTLAFLDRVG
jgi:dienelactone hydrolase